MTPLRPAFLTISPQPLQMSTRRRMRHASATLTALCLSASLLAACGGGGGSEPHATTPAGNTGALALADHNTPGNASDTPEDDIWFQDESPFSSENTLKEGDGVTAKASITQPVIIRAPSFGPLGQTVRVGVPITRIPGVYRNGSAVAGFRSRNGKDIPEGRQATYTPTQADVGKQLVYRERVLNPRTNEYILAYSAPVTVVSNAPEPASPATTTLRPPVIDTGNTRIRAGHTIRILAGAYQNGEISRRQWFRNGQAIPGATKDTYIPTSDDIGKTLSYAETVRNPASGAVTVVRSESIRVVASNYPSILSLPLTSVHGETIAVGQHLSGQSGRYQWGHVRQSYWFIDNVIAGRGNSFTPLPAHLGKMLTYTEEIEGDSGDIVWLSAPALKVTISPPVSHTTNADNATAPTPPHQPAAPTASAPQPQNPARQQTPATSTAGITRDDLCWNILEKHPVKLMSGQENAHVPDRQAPATGVAVQEPTYHTCEVRLTHNRQLSGNEKSHRNDYSRRQAFNADNTRLLMSASDGYWHLYDAHTGKYLHVLNGLAGDAEPQWDHANPHVLYYVPTNGVGMTINELNVDTNQHHVVADLSRDLQRLWPDANSAWTKSEGSPSADNRYWCLMVDNAQWQGLGVFTWDIKEKRILGHMNLPERPDHVSMSPTGKYCVISWANSPTLGTRAYTPDFSSAHPASPEHRPYLQLHAQSEHSDLALNKKGEDVYVSIDYQSDSGDLFMVNLNTGRRTTLFPTYLSGTATALHVSGKAYGQPGWAVISTYGEYHSGNQSASLRNTSLQQWLHRKIFAVSLEDKPKIRPLAHADSDSRSEWQQDAYWAEPQATVSRDFTRVLFNSTLNSDRVEDIETYMLVMPKGALDH